MKYKKGNIPFNKGRKMDTYMSEESINKVKTTQFKSGLEHSGTNHPSWEGGVQEMTNDCTYLWTDTNKRVRRPREIYIRHHGLIPKGHVIYHKDGNKYNDNISNLEAISRKELLRRNRSED